MIISSYSKKLLFFLSDPPYLIKKLRNNLNSSGDKNLNDRYARHLKKDHLHFITWQHVIDVYDRDKRRASYSSPLRKQHVFLDSLSKMKVKYAVDVLSSSVQREMPLNDNNIQKRLKHFVRDCEKLWTVFNDKGNLESPDDEHFVKLTEIIDYFHTWK